MIVFVLALLVRGAWGGYRLAQAHDPAAVEFPDEEQYWLMATSLHAGQGLEDEFGFRATRMPLYPAALSLAAGLEHGVPVAKVIQWFVGAAAAALTIGVATSLFGRRVGLVAGFWVALDPFMIFFSSLLLTETLFTAALLGLWWVVLPALSPNGRSAPPGQWIAIGIVAALCVYLRESSLGLVAVLLAFAVICRGFDRRVLIGAVLTGLTVVIALVPWAARNHRVTGKWCWLTHRAGVSLYDGVGPQADGSSNLGDIQQMDAVRGMDEVAWNQYFLDESIRAIREDPARIARLAGTKLARTWNPVPNVESYQSWFVRFVSAAWMIPTFALAIVSVMVLPRIRGSSGVSIALLLLLPALYVSVLHTLFVGSVRYRLTAMPMLEILAAFALVVLYDRSGTGFQPVKNTGCKPVPHGGRGVDE
ncbi:MAG: glycosyltransferase family protein [Planctomycetota bacterium]